MLKKGCVPRTLREVGRRLSKRRSNSSSARAVENDTAGANVRYALKDHRSELNRLRIQHNIFSGQCQNFYKQGLISYGDKIVDVGCGPGYNTTELAEIAGKDGSVFAVDSSVKSLEFLKQRAASDGWEEGASGVLVHESGQLGNIWPVHASIEEPMPATHAKSMQGLDRAFVRWVLTWLENPNQAIQHIGKMLRPGGTVAIFDYYHVKTFALHSPVPTPMFDKLLDTLLDEWLQHGNPSVGLDIPHYLLENNFEVSSVEPFAPIIRAGSTEWIWPTTYFYTQINRIHRDNPKTFTKSDVERFLVEWEEIGKHGGASFYSPPMMCEIIGTKKL